MKLRFLLLLCCMCTCLLRPAAAETLLIVGDSLSAAYGMPVDQGWVALLQEQLAAEDCPCTIVNASISGDTTAAARARLSQTITRHRPDIVLLQLGGNDGLRGLSPEAMKHNLAAMITTVHDHGARVLLIGVQLPPNYGPLYTGKFEAIYRELAEEHGVALLPSLVAGIGTETELMQADGIHPNNAAQAKIAARVREHLLPLLHNGPVTRD